MTLCVVFDFDGVLVDSNAVKRQAYFDIFPPLGSGTAPIVEQILARDVDGDRFQLIRGILSALRQSGLADGSEPDDAQVADLARRYNDICEHHAATCPEVRGASTAISRLFPAHPLYVVSATPEPPLRRIIERRGWTRYFRDVFGRPGSKSEHLRTVMAREAIGADDLLMIGDGRRDVDAASEVGARFIGVRNRFNDFEPSSLLLIDDLSRLPELIESTGPATPLQTRD